MITGRATTYVWDHEQDVGGLSKLNYFETQPSEIWNKSNLAISLLVDIYCELYEPVFYLCESFYFLINNGYKSV